MICASCHSEIVDGKKFCGKCGAAVSVTVPALVPVAPYPSRCPKCQSDILPGKKFCGVCGIATVLQQPLSPPTSRITASPEVAPQQKCAHCGAELNAGAKFCGSCGNLSAAADPAAVVVSARPSKDVPVSQSETPAPLRRPASMSREATNIHSAPPQPLSLPAPVPRPVLKPLPTAQPAARPGFWRGHKLVVIGSAAVVVLAAGGITYWFTHRRPAANDVPIVNAPVPQSAPTTSDQSATMPGPQAPDASAEHTTGEPQETADVATPPTPPPSKSGRIEAKPAPVPVHPAYEEAHHSAEQAFYASRFLDPPEDSALFWSRKAKSLGDPGASDIEDQVFEKEMGSVQNTMQAHQYTQAQAQIAELARYFPDRPQVQQLAGTIQQEQQRYTEQVEQQRRQADLAAQTKTFQVRHRHFSAFVNSNGSAITFCSGTLTVTPDGSVRYECTSTNDPKGRCDHVIFPAGSLKDAKLRSDGSLHLASQQYGNFDFYGDANSLQQALAVISPLVRR